MESFNYDQNDIHLRYDSARKLPDETVLLWLERVASHVERAKIEVILDLGCGTGRFSGALASFFGAQVYAVDPSAKMLEVAREQACNPRVRFLEGRAEQIPLEEEVADLIFLSMVYHHIEDKAEAFREFRRVLKPEGRWPSAPPRASIWTHISGSPSFPRRARLNGAGHPRRMS